MFLCTLLVKMNVVVHITGLLLILECLLTIYVSASAQTKITMSGHSQDSHYTDRSTNKAMMTSFHLTSQIHKREATAPTPSTYPIPTPAPDGVTSTLCPDGCTFEEQYFCEPVDCDVPCVDGVKLPGECCATCLNGRPN